MKQLNHFNNYGFVLAKITQALGYYWDGANSVSIYMYWNPMGSLVLEYGFCKSTFNKMPGMESRYWYQTGNIPYFQTRSPYNPWGGFNSDIFYVRGYVKNVAGISWSDVIMVNTKDYRKYAPEVTTSAVNNIYSTRGIGGGQVTNDGGDPVAERGICWSTSQNPTTTNDRTIDGPGTGTFTSEIKKLTPNTVYYARAYAINTVDIAFGSQVTFKTNAAGVPTTFIIDLKDVSANTVTAYGRIYDNGGSAVTQKGFVWNTTGNPNRLSDHVVLADGTGDADFSKAMTGLPSGTKIYAKAFGVNVSGTGYGDQTIFTTTGTATNIAFTLSTVSISSTWSPRLLTKTGTILHWEVTGAVTVSVDGNTPTFNFSNPGTKNIVVTSMDGASGLSLIYLNGLDLTLLDVSYACALEDLNCMGNSLTSLNVSQNPKLKILNCYWNQLGSLDVSKNLFLEELGCHTCNLTSLDVSKNTLLKLLDIRSNAISIINTSNLPLLNRLYIDQNPSIAFNITLNTNLNTLGCSGCGYTSISQINISNNSNLTKLDVSSNSLPLSALNSIIDTLVAFNKAGSYFSSLSQIPMQYLDNSKVAPLIAIWASVNVNSH